MSDPPLFAFTRTAAVFPPLVNTANTSPTTNVLEERAADVAVGLSPSRKDFERPVMVPAGPMLTALAVPWGVSVLPSQRMSPPEVAVAPVSRFKAPLVIVKVLVLLKSASRAMGSARAMAAQNNR